MASPYQESQVLDLSKLHLGIVDFAKTYELQYYSTKPRLFPVAQFHHHRSKELGGSFLLIVILSKGLFVFLASL